MASTDRLVLDADPRLGRELQRIGQARMVFFAGLPGTGKSLLVHQLAHLGDAAGRTVHLLQWDVVRPAFEATGAGTRYPIVDGVTHPVIRKAAGLWARAAVVAWHARLPAPQHLLVGETPFTGNRFIELARRQPDPAEPVLASPDCRFVIPVPSRPVRAHLESERARRAIEPLHEREREDAPPQVLRALWRDLVRVARQLRLTDGGAASDAASAAVTTGCAAREDARLRASAQETGSEGGDAEPAWDPELYRRVYEAVLRSRHVDVLRLDTVLPTSALSVYRFSMAVRDLRPSAEEAEGLIEEVERRYPTLEPLQREIERWWDVDQG